MAKNMVLLLFLYAKVSWALFLSSWVGNVNQDEKRAWKEIWLFQLCPASCICSAHFEMFSSEEVEEKNKADLQNKTAIVAGW